MQVKATKIIDLNKTKLIKSNITKMPVILFISAITGILSGVLLEIITEYVNKSSASYFEAYISQTLNKSVIENLAGYFIYNFGFIFFSFIMGLCSIGSIFLIPVPFFKGIGIGALCGYIYSSYMFKGMIYCTVLVFPASLILFISIILACNESYYMSKDINSKLNSGIESSYGLQMNMYYLRYAVIFAVFTVSALMYSLSVYLFGKII